MKQAVPYIVLTLIAACLLSCNDNPLSNKDAKQGNIVLGDSSTIVTETDTAYLSDQVADLEPHELVHSIVQEGKTTASQPATNNPPQSLPADRAHGFAINFGHGVQVSFSGITTREFQQQDPQKAAGVSYAVASGDLRKSVMTVSGLHNIKVRMRYQSYLALQSGKEKLSLQNMGGFLSDWEELSGQGTYSLQSLQHISFKSVSNATIRNAVIRAARSSRMNTQKRNVWLGSVKNTKSAKDAPCHIELDNVQWQVSGQTADGRQLFKTIRLEP